MHVNCYLVGLLVKLKDTETKIKETWQSNFRLSVKYCTDSIWILLHRQYLNFIAQTVFEFYCTDSIWILLHRHVFEFYCTDSIWISLHRQYLYFIAQTVFVFYCADIIWILLYGQYLNLIAQRVFVFYCTDSICILLHRQYLNFIEPTLCPISGVTSCKGNPEIRLKFDKRKRLPKFRIGV